MTHAPEMEKAVDLLPCPFCGSEARSLSARVSEDCEEARVECTSCGAAGPADEDAYANHAAAASYWNRRAPSLSLSGRREEIARIIKQHCCRRDNGNDLTQQAALEIADAILALPAPECRAGEPSAERFEKLRKAYQEMEATCAAYRAAAKIDLLTLDADRRELALWAAGEAARWLDPRAGGGSADKHGLQLEKIAGILALSASPRSAEGWQKMVEFVRWAIRESVFDGCALDGADVESKAEALGIIVRVAYDPAIHGDSDAAQPGDDWFVFDDWHPAAPPVSEPGE